MLRTESDCCLNLDVMSIRTSIEYDNRLGSSLGDFALPVHSGAATCGLVFMLGGLAPCWKQTVAYYITSNAIDRSVLSNIVVKLILHCHITGSSVDAITSDMGSFNRAMWKKTLCS